MVSKKKHLHESGIIKAGAEVYILHDNKVLMFKRSDDSPMFPGFWIGPGGHVDEDEHFLSAAIREVSEETGVQIQKKDIQLKAITIHKRPSRNEVWMLPIFLAKIDSNQLPKNSSEGNAEWIQIEKLKNMGNVFPSAKYYFNHVLNDLPGILYTNITWDDKGIVKENDVCIDQDY